MSEQFYQECDMCGKNKYCANYNKCCEHCFHSVEVALCETCLRRLLGEKVDEGIPDLWKDLQ